MKELPLFEDAFLRAQWHGEYAAFAASPEAARLEQRLVAWADREVLKETASEAAFLQRFFVETWGYRTQGATDFAGYTCRPQFEVARAGQGGGAGFADVAEAFDGRRLIKRLLDLRATADTGLRDRIVALDAEITSLDADLAAREAALNATLYRLYGLTPEEIALVEGA